MDHKNLFMTRTTYRLLRLEYLIALVVCVVLALAHLGEIRWPVFLGLFAVIDVIGYLPGLFIWIRRHGEVPRAFYVSYNVAHHLGTSAALAGLWCLVVGPEWALLALPIHLMGDRALFGNMLKPFGVSFEPKTHPAVRGVRPRLSPPAQHAPAEHRRGVGARCCTCRRAGCPLSQRRRIGWDARPAGGPARRPRRQPLRVPGGQPGHGVLRDPRAWTASSPTGGPAGCGCSSAGWSPRPHDRDRLLGAFLADTRASGQRAMAVQLTPADVDTFRRHGYRINQLGSSYALDLSRQSLAGKHFVQLRNKISRARRAGVLVARGRRRPARCPPSWPRSSPSWIGSGWAPRDPMTNSPS